MRNLIFVAVFFAACATEVRQYRPDGKPMPLPSEMDEGRRLCAEKCQRYHRTFKEYEPNGDCDCNPIVYGAEVAPNTTQM